MKLNLTQDLIDQATEQDMRIMFHGCGKPLDGFTSQHVGRGGDDNSALGLHLAEYPASAAEFADTASAHGEGDGVVLAVLVPAANPHTISSYDEFFGFDENGDPDTAMGRAGFEALRLRLLEKGHDIVDYEDGEMGAISVALDPEQATVVGVMSISQAYQMEDYLSHTPDALSTQNKLSALQFVSSPTPPRRPGP